MNETIDVELTGLLTGELDPEKARALKQRLERDRDLARRFQVLEESWQSLELPPPSPIPLGSKAQIVAQARALQIERSELDWGRAPTWARASAGLALAAGIVLGVGLSDFESLASPGQTTEIVQNESALEWSVSEPGLAELYAEAVEQSTWMQEEENGS